MLDRLWRKGGPHSLLIGMETGTTTMGNSLASPQKVKTRATM